MYKYKFQICELAHAQIEERRGVPAGICRSCIQDPKVVARNTKIDQQIYLLTAGKGLRQTKHLYHELHNFINPFTHSYICLRICKHKDKTL